MDKQNMMRSPLEILKSALGEHFGYDSYESAILKLRGSLQNIDYYKLSWPLVVDLINSRKLPEGIALSLIHGNANLSLHKNSDEEAYRWLDLMLKNVSSRERVIPYE